MRKTTIETTMEIRLLNAAIEQFDRLTKYQYDSVYSLEFLAFTATEMCRGLQGAGKYTEGLRTVACIFRRNIPKN